MLFRLLLRRSAVKFCTGLSAPRRAWRPIANAKACSRMFPNGLAPPLLVPSPLLLLFLVVVAMSSLLVLVAVLLVYGGDGCGGAGSSMPHPTCDSLQADAKRTPFNPSSCGHR